MRHDQSTYAPMIDQILKRWCSSVSETTRFALGAEAAGLRADASSRAPTLSGKIVERSDLRIYLARGRLRSARNYGFPADP
jgi:hypothetical protein